MRGSTRRDWPRLLQFDASRFYLPAGIMFPVDTRELARARCEIA
jgi:hypothetical protein